MTGPMEIPQARRMRRPSWRDPRLGVGVLLVAGSVALGTWAVRDAGATVEVYAASHTLTPGSILAAEDLHLREVRLGEDESRYLLPEDLEASGRVALRTVGEGELVPRSAVGEPEVVDLQPVVVDLELAVPAGLAPGIRVDLWHAPAPAALGEAAPSPELLVPELVVSEVLKDDAMIPGAGGTAVELLVPRSEVAAVLAALTAEGELVLVPSTAGQRSVSGDDGHASVSSTSEDL